MEAPSGLRVIALGLLLVSTSGAACARPPLRGAPGAPPAAVSGAPPDGVARRPPPALEPAAPASAAPPARDPRVAGEAPLASPPPPAPAPPAPGARAASSDLVPVDADDLVWGEPTAPVTLVEFTDLECPFCARVLPTIERLKERYGPSRLRVVVKHYPLPFHRHAERRARMTAAVLAVHGQDAAHRFLARMFEQQRTLPDDGESVVAALGLDLARVLAAAGAPAARAAIDRDLALVQRLGIRGTPAFLVNGVLIPGARPIEAYTEVIADELQAAAALLRAGVPAEAVYPSRVAVNWRQPAPEAPSAEPAPKAAPSPDSTVHFVPIEGAPAEGPRDALVTVVEFLDHQCPYCQRVEATRRALQEKYGKDLRWVMRHLPLDFHLHARRAATLALEARRQRGDRGYFDATRRLLERAPALDEERLIALGQELSLDLGGVRRALAQGAHDAAIDADLDLAADLGVRGTPNFFINGRRLSGAQPLERFEALIDERLAAARALVARGVPRRGVYARTMEGAERPPAPERREVPIPREAPSRGPAGAPVVIQMFGDFECPFCLKAARTLRELEARFPGKIRVVWRHLPLSFHARARPAATAALEAQAQRGAAGFFAMHDRLFALLGTPEGQSAAALRREAEALGLDLARFDAAMTDGRHDRSLAADLRAAEEAGFDSTPTFLVNGVVVEGAKPLAAFASTVRRALRARRARP